MTPEQKIKWAIVARAAEFNKTTVPPYPCDNIDELYEQLEEKDEHWDALFNIREGEIETNIPAPTSRHYESKSVAMQMPDKTWVGWTYWYGGGKHGEPEAVDWMNYSYNLNCKEEEKMVVIRTFSLV